MDWLNEKEVELAMAWRMGFFNAKNGGTLDTLVSESENYARWACWCDEGGDVSPDGRLRRVTAWMKKDS